MQAGNYPSLTGNLSAFQQRGSIGRLEAAQIRKVSSQACHTACRQAYFPDW